VRIAVDAPNDCLTAPAFFERVRRRTARVRQAAPEEPARRFSLTIEEKERVSGKLLTESPDGTTALREVEGASCQEVADSPSRWLVARHSGSARGSELARPTRIHCPRH
jgi:hypothetical protein